MTQLNTDSPPWLRFKSFYMWLTSLEATTVIESPVPNWLDACGVGLPCICGGVIAGTLSDGVLVTSDERIGIVHRQTILGETTVSDLIALCDRIYRGETA